MLYQISSCSTANYVACQHLQVVLTRPLSSLAQRHQRHCRAVLMILMLEEVEGGKTSIPLRYRSLKDWQIHYEGRSVKRRPQPRKRPGRRRIAIPAQRPQHGVGGNHVRPGTSR